MTFVAQGCWESHGDDGDPLYQEVQYTELEGFLEITLTDGSTERLSFPGNGCSVGGEMKWFADGPPPPRNDENQDYFFFGACEGRFRFYFLSDTMVFPPNERGWPNEDQVVDGIFSLAGSDIPVPFTVTLGESVGEILPLPDGATPDYVRDFTVTASFDCAEEPELGCEGTYELELHTRLTSDSVSFEW